MSIYSRDTIETAAQTAAANRRGGCDAVCPFPEAHEAAEVWRTAYRAELERLNEEEVSHG